MQKAPLNFKWDNLFPFLSTIMPDNAPFFLVATQLLSAFLIILSTLGTASRHSHIPKVVAVESQVALVSLIKTSGSFNSSMFGANVTATAHNSDEVPDPDTAVALLISHSLFILDFQLEGRRLAFSGFSKHSTDL